MAIGDLTDGNVVGAGAMAPSRVKRDSAAPDVSHSTGTGEGGTAAISASTGTPVVAGGAEAFSARIRTLLKARLGDEIFNSWFNSLEIDGCENGIVRASVPVKFLRNWIQSHYADALLACCRAEFPDAELFFLAGADSLRDLPTWREPERITQLATLVACNRPGLPELSYEQVTAWIGTDLAKRIVTQQIPGTDISASALRNRIQNGRNLRFLTPRAVEAFVIEHKLYATTKN